MGLKHEKYKTFPVLTKLFSPGSTFEWKMKLKYYCPCCLSLQYAVKLEMSDKFIVKYGHTPTLNLFDI